MNTKFTILVAAGLLFAGITQAQGSVAADKADFRNPPRHAVVREHKPRQVKHKVHHHKKHMKHRHHRMTHHK